MSKQEGVQPEMDERLFFENREIITITWSECGLTLLLSLLMCVEHISKARSHIGELARTAQRVCCLFCERTGEVLLHEFLAYRCV